MIFSAAKDLGQLSKLKVRTRFQSMLKKTFQQCSLKVMNKYSSNVIKTSIESYLVFNSILYLYIIYGTFFSPGNVLVAFNQMLIFVHF